jgi:hypothetical protein
MDLWLYSAPITNHRINEILDLMSQGDEAHPVFVHCQKGEDRTGLVVGLYRVLNQKWAPQDAWNEMFKFGYHPHFRALTHYFEKRTGWRPAKNSPISSGENENADGTTLSADSGISAD